MQENSFMISILIAVCFSLLKYVEMKYVVKEMKPLKLWVRDGILVFVCSMIGFFLVDQMNQLNKQSGGSSAHIFTNAPDF
jgi:hypothetical protein